MTRSAEDYERLKMEARRNAGKKDIEDTAKELLSRIECVSGNMEAGDYSIFRNELEIENDIIKAQELAKSIARRLENAERHLNIVVSKYLAGHPEEARKRAQEERFKNQEKFVGKKNVDPEDSYEYSYEDKQEMKHHKKIGKAKRKAEKQKDKDIRVTSIQIFDAIVEKSDVDLATNAHLDFCYGDTETSVKLYRNVETMLDNFFGDDVSRVIYDIYENRVRDEWDQRKAAEEAEVELSKEVPEETVPDFLKKKIAQGPLSQEEAMRRGTVAFYNDLYSIFNNSMQFVEDFDGKGPHPETLQVTAAEGLIALEAGDLYGIKVGVRNPRA